MEFNDRRSGKGSSSTRVLGESMPASYKPEDFPGGRYTVSHIYAGGGSHSVHSSMDEAVAAVRDHVVGLAKNIRSMRGKPIDGAAIPSAFSIRHSSRDYPIASGSVIATPRDGGNTHEVSFSYDKSPVVHEGEMRDRATAFEATQQRHIRGK